MNGTYGHHAEAASSRLHAVRYKQAFDKYISEKGYTDVRTLVAFSGIVEDPDGAVRWLDKTWTVAPFDVWVADEITLSVAGSAHPVHR